MVGEIHLATIYFTDGSAAKLRPVLLLKQNSFGDYLYLPLTTNLNTPGTVIDNNFLTEGYLPKESVVVHEKIGVVAPALLHKKIGTLVDVVMWEITGELLNFLQV